MLGNDELEEAREKTKITALKWHEMTEQEQKLVLNNNAPTLVDEALLSFVEFITKANCYYFDRLGNIYVHNVEQEITF